MPGLFERERRHLLSIAFRILGSESDAEDVVQEAWIRFSGADTTSVRNISAFLTTITTRLCLDVIRRRREIPQRADDMHVESFENPEETVLLANELTGAFTIVLEELTPPQRVALVLHDAFGVSFDDVAHILKTTTGSATKLASRARERIRRRAEVHAESKEARTVAAAFLRAAQEGDVDHLIELLDPDAIRIADPHVLAPGGAQRIQGAQRIAAEAQSYKTNARNARLASIDGRPAIAVYSGSTVRAVLILNVAHGRIYHFDVVADPSRLALLRHEALSE